MAIVEHDWSLTDETTLKAVDSILARIEKNMVDEGYMRTLQKLPYQRSKAIANLDYAKSLLLKLEQLKPPQTSRNTAPNTTRYRLVLKTFEERLDEMEEAEANSKTAAGAPDSSDDSDNEDVQELLRRFAPARPSTGLETEEQPSISPATSKDTSPTSSSDAPTHAAAATLTSTIRSRRQNDNSSTTIPANPSTATTTSISTPFAARPQTATSTNESLMTSHSLTQEDLTTSLLTLAQALNKSTLAFSSALDDSDTLVDGVSKGLDKNIEKMSLAGRAMLQLKGQGRGSGGPLGRMWALWDSVGLWIKVAVAWVVLLAVMFLLPKLRL